MTIPIIMIVSQIGLLSSLEQLHGELHLHCLASRGTMVPVMVIVGGVQVMIMKINILCCCGVCVSRFFIIQFFP